MVWRLALAKTGDVGVCFWSWNPFGVVKGHQETVAIYENPMPTSLQAITELIAAMGTPQKGSPSKAKECAEEGKTIGWEDHRLGDVSLRPKGTSVRSFPAFFKCSMFEPRPSANMFYPPTNIDCLRTTSARVSQKPARIRC